MQTPAVVLSIVCLHAQRCVRVFWANLGAGGQLHWCDLLGSSECFTYTTWVHLTESSCQPLGVCHIIPILHLGN